MQIADENDSDLRYLEVPLKGKNKTLVKILGGGSSTQDDPCRSSHGHLLGGRDPCNHCGVDAYASHWQARLDLAGGWQA